MFQLGGIVVTLINGVFGLLLWRRLRAAYPRRAGLINGVCAAGFLLIAPPALFIELVPA